MARIPSPHSPHPWTYREDALSYYVLDANGVHVAAVSKNTNRLAEGNLLAILTAPDVLEALRCQPAYGDVWKRRLREAYACASGLLETYLPARKRK